MAEMTKEVIVDLCKANGGYAAPRLNDQLFLHCKGFHKIENLEEYTEVKVLWLESNAISDLSGLEHQSESLISLFLQHNTIRSLSSLQVPLHNLRVLNVSNNYLTSLSGIAQACPLLETLQASHNHITSLAACAELHALCKTLTSVDLSYNKIENVFDSACDTDGDTCSKVVNNNNCDNVNSCIQNVSNNSEKSKEAENDADNNKICNTNTYSLECKEMNGEETNKCDRVNKQTTATNKTCSCCRQEDDKDENEDEDDIYIVDAENANADAVRIHSNDKSTKIETEKAMSDAEIKQTQEQEREKEWSEWSAASHFTNGNKRKTHVSTNTAALANNALDVVKFFKSLPLVSVIYLHGNGIVRNLKQYRRNMILHLPALTYLDERPVFTEERRVVEAWGRGGEAAEREERKRIQDEKRAHLNSCVSVLTGQMNAHREIRDRLNAEWEQHRRQELEELTAMRRANRDARDAVIVQEDNARVQIEKEEQDLWWNMEDIFAKEHAEYTREEAKHWHEYKQKVEVESVYAEVQRELTSAGELSSESSLEDDKKTINGNISTSNNSERTNTVLTEADAILANTQHEDNVSSNSDNKESCSNQVEEDHEAAVRDLLMSDEEVMRAMDAEIELVLNSVSDSIKAYRTKTSNAIVDRLSS